MGGGGSLKSNTLPCPFSFLPALQLQPDSKLLRYRDDRHVFQEFHQIPGIRAYPSGTLLRYSEYSPLFPQRRDQTRPAGPLKQVCVVLHRDSWRWRNGKYIDCHLFSLFFGLIGY